MKLVADTNIFIAVALNEPEKTTIIDCTRGYDLVAPDVLPFEIGNALSALRKKGLLRQEEIIQAWDQIRKISVGLRRIDIRASLKLALQYNIYAYDAYFLELALNQRCPLITLDRKMKQVAEGIGISILEVKS
jgi:predicted nucleic acid-binding protein